MTSWNYGLGKLKGKIYLVENTWENYKWRGCFRVGWSELFKHPKMVIKDLFGQKKYIGKFFAIRRGERKFFKRINKIIKGIKI